MWKEQDLEYFLKMSRHGLEVAQEMAAEKKFSDSLALTARESGSQGIQALLMIFKVFECSFEEARYLAEQSEIYYNKAKTGGEKQSAMYGNLAIAYGVQALIMYFERQKRTG
ncbi:MAG: hypothetical protein NTX14_02390 [Candidatus Nealsonbacteria bacterium]|nr:hypothetical protein [Candidatus Nealsonbacteria bacterium]